MTRRTLPYKYELFIEHEDGHTEVLQLSSHLTDMKSVCDGYEARYNCTVLKIKRLPDHEKD